MPASSPVTPLLLHALKYFEVAARNLSFTRTAEEMHVTQGAVSQQIKGLEEQLGVRLFRRLHRGLELTHEGERLHRVAAKALRELEAEIQAIVPGATGNALFIRSSPSFSMMWLMPRLNAFARLYPDIELRLRGELFGMSASRMNVEAIDALVLYDRMPEPAGEREGQRTIMLMEEYLVPVASPAYLEKQGPLLQASDFGTRTLLHDDSPWEGARSYAEWGEWVRAATGNDSDEVENFGRHGHQYNLSQLAVNAALHDQGIAVARASLIVNELESGQLVPVVPLCARTSARYFLVLSERGGKDRSMATFRDWIVEECRAFETARDALLQRIVRIV